MTVEYKVEVIRTEETIGFSYSDYSKALSSYVERVQSACNVVAMCPVTITISISRKIDNEDWVRMKYIGMSGSDWAHQSF